MKLTDKEKLALSYAVTRANCSAESLAAECGIQARSLRRGIELLLEKKVFRRRTIVLNPSVLGYTRFKVYLHYPYISDAEIDRFRTALYSCEGLAAASELGGDYQFEAEFFAKSEFDLEKHLEWLQEAVKGKVTVQAIRVILSTEIFGTRIHADRPEQIPSIKIEHHDQSYSLKENEELTLKYLAEENYQSIEELSRITKIPASSFLHRVKKLEEGHVIAGHYYVYDTKPLSASPFVLFIGGLSIASPSHKEIQTFCRKSKIVAFTERTLGDVSHQILIDSRSFEEATSFANRLKIAMRNDNATIVIVPQLQFIKYSAFPFAVHAIS